LLVAHAPALAAYSWVAFVMRTPSLAQALSAAWLLPLTAVADAS
jgi:hypothetical protein